MEGGRFVAETRLAGAELAEIFGSFGDIVTIKAESKTANVFTTDGDVEKDLGSNGTACSSGRDGADSGAGTRCCVSGSCRAGHEKGCCVGSEASMASSRSDCRCGGSHATKAGSSGGLEKEKVKRVRR